MDLLDFIKTAQSMGFSTEGRTAWGTLSGRWFGLGLNAGGEMSMRAAVESGSESGRLALDSWLAEQKSAGTLADWSDDQGAIVVRFPNAALAAPDLPGFAAAFSARAAELDLRPACWKCRAAVDAPPAIVEGEALGLCGACYNSLEQASRELDSSKRMKPGPLALAFGGALLGGLVGSIVWILIKLAGFYASIAGLAIAWAAFKGYTLARGKVNKATPWLLGLAVLLSVVVAEGASLVIEVMKVFKDEGLSLTLKEAIQFLPIILQQEGVMKEILGNLALGVLFAGLGSWQIIKNLATAAKVPVLNIRRPGTAA